VKKTLQGAVDSGVTLAYWWCYQSDRKQDQANRQRFDIDADRNPELVRCVVEANQQLQAKLRTSSISDR
jgi:hypothetical protein